MGTPQTPATSTSPRIRSRLSSVLEKLAGHLDRRFEKDGKWAGVGPYCG